MKNIDIMMAMCMIGVCNQISVTVRRYWTSFANLEIDKIQDMSYVPNGIAVFRKDGRIIQEGAENIDSNAETIDGVDKHYLLVYAKVVQYGTKVMVQIDCSTTTMPFECQMEILHNNYTVQSIRYSGGECYDTLGKCLHRKCSCSEDCSSFHWNVITSSIQTNDSFGCKIRIYNSTSTLFYKVYTIVVYNGTDFTSPSSVISPVKTEIKHVVQTPPNPSKGSITFVVFLVIAIIGPVSMAMQLSMIYHLRKRGTRSQGYNLVPLHHVTEVDMDE